MATLRKKAANPIDVHVGSRVRAARMLLKLSQEKLGGSLGLTFQQVQKYEKGANRIGSSRLLQIAVIVGRPVGWFFEGAPAAKVNGRAPPADPCQELGTSRDGVQLAQAYLKLDHSKRHALVRFVRSIAGEDEGDEGARR